MTETVLCRLDGITGGAHFQIEDGLCVIGIGVGGAPAPAEIEVIDGDVALVGGAI